MRATVLSLGLIGVILTACRSGNTPQGQAQTSSKAPGSDSAIGALQARAQQASRWPGCYAFTWEDSLRLHRLPSGARLEAQRDSGMPSPPFHILFFMASLGGQSDSGPLPPHLDHAWWEPLGSDSLDLTIVDPYNIQWEIALGPNGDSLVGVATGMDGDAAWGPFAASARRIPCQQ
jgi:hypothetical protein